MLINCDIGERGVAHPTDDALMEHIDIANVACGGHAGDHESVAYYLALAEKLGVGVSAHLSYPDREHFGRKVLEIPNTALLHSLDAQYALLGHVKRVKLHGALYNRANVDPLLARDIALWFRENGVAEVLTQHDAQLDRACRELGITVIEEAFLDRTYVVEEGQLRLASREHPHALIHDPETALRQYHCLKRGFVEAEGEALTLVAKTLCIHSDSPASLAIARKVRGV